MSVETSIYERVLCGGWGSLPKSTVFQDCDLQNMWDRINAALSTRVEDKIIQEVTRETLGKLGIPYQAGLEIPVISNRNFRDHCIGIWTDESWKLNNPTALLLATFKKSEWLLASNLRTPVYFRNNILPKLLGFAQTEKQKTVVKLKPTRFDDADLAKIQSALAGCTEMYPDDFETLVVKATNKKASKHTLETLIGRLGIERLSICKRPKPSQPQSNPVQ